MKLRLSIFILLLLSAVGTYNLIKQGNQLDEDIAYTYSNVVNYHRDMRYVYQAQKDMKEHHKKHMMELEQMRKELSEFRMFK